MESISNQLDLAGRPLDAGKKKEADKEFKEGQKALKTSLFKWKPDHLTA